MIYPDSPYPTGDTLPMPVAPTTATGNNNKATNTEPVQYSRHVNLFGDAVYNVTVNREVKSSDDIRALRFSTWHEEKPD
eukprot:1186776-Rhodomonas_salina.1